MIATLAAKIKTVVAQTTGISVDEVNRRLAKTHRSPGNHLIIAPAARQFWVQLREVEPKNLHERVLVENWKREFQWSDGDVVEDPVEDWELENWAYTQYELRPGEIAGFLARHDVETPYADEDDNAAFQSAQRGSIPQEDDGDGALVVDSDRDRENDGWAEYMQPVGMGDFYLNSGAWQGLPHVTRDAIALTTDWIALSLWADRLIKWDIADKPFDGGMPESFRPFVSLIQGAKSLAEFSDNLKTERLSTWDMVRALIREDVESAWIDAVRAYTERKIDVIALALLAHRLTSFTRFSPEEMLERASAIPWRSHADDESVLGNVADFLVEYQGELDEIEEDLGTIGRTAPEAWEEQKIADTWTQTFENQMQEHWKKQFNQPGDCFAARWTGEGDVAYSVAYRDAILGGQDGMDAHQRALSARRGLR